MSFRDNLQHLRATRNMTQEQLAMLLGVSRQSVTKWEAEKSYPEMDKLLKICQVFDCTLDDLVQGNLTARPKEPAAASVPAGPVADICGYDEHMVRFAKRISVGVPFFILGPAASVFVQDALPLLMFGTDASYDYEVMSRFEPFGLTALLAFLLVGMVILIPTVTEHSSFVRAHPYVEDFYTEGQRSAAARQLALAVVAGMAFIFAGVAFAAFHDFDPWENGSTSVLLVLVAVAVFLFVRYALLYDRMDVEGYNKSVVDDLEVEDINNSPLDEGRKEVLLQWHARSKKINAICGTIMLVATIIALAWLFIVPSFYGGFDHVDWGNSLAGYFWLPWPIGGIACGIVAILSDAFGDK